jgi:hypothetical protein
VTDTLAARRRGLPRDAALITGRIHPATATLVVLSLGAAVLLLYAGRHLTFFYDEWNWILDRRGGSLGTYLDPHNGHLSLFPVAVYKLLFELVGLRHYWPYRAVCVALHLLCCVLLYVLVSPRLGRWPALVPAALLLFLGAAWQDLLWPIQIGYLASVAGGLGALALLERGGRLADVLAAALLTWAVSASGVGIAFLAAAAVLLLVQPGGLKRIWVVAIPVALFAVWYIGWGTSEHVTSGGVLGAPQYVADAAAAAAGGIGGLSTAWGPPLAIAGIALAVLGLRRRAASPPPLLLAAIAGALVFWILAAVTRADVAEPGASRYIYIGAVFILLIAAEAASGIRTRGWGLAAALILLAGALIANIGALRAGERSLRTTDDSVRASLASVELAAPVVARPFVPEPVGAPQITAGRYLAASRDLGSPALTLGELGRAPERIRQIADSTLVRAEALGPSPGARPPSCAALPASPELTIPAGRKLVIQLRRPVAASLLLRRFASYFPAAPLATVRAATAAIAFPADLAPQVPWHVMIEGREVAQACLT